MPGLGADIKPGSGESSGLCQRNCLCSCGGDHNSTLLSSPAVRKEVAAADIALPSLDAASVSVFQAIDRPAQGLKIEDIIKGLKEFRREYAGEIWLEVMLVKGVNDHEADLIARAVESTEPDRIQLNTVVRMPAEPVKPLSEEEMKKMLEIFPGQS